MVAAPLMADDFMPPSSTELDPKVEARVNALIAQLTTDEKIGLVAGPLYMNTQAIPRLKIPALKFSDGPVGVRCWGKSTAYPADVMLAATWDSDMATAMGTAIGRDARSRGVNVVLGPGTNIYREAQDSRNFEYVGEDPFLASAMVTGFIKGLQSQDVSACIKHYVANEQETQRGTTNTIVSRRALEEIYFPPFRAAIEDAHVWTLMAAYNKVNGDWCTANHFLMTDILRDGWKFKGLAMSDWGACHDAEKDLNAGLDLEMDIKPRQIYTPEKIKPLLESGAVSMATLDEHVRRLLRTMAEMGWLDRDQTDASIPANDPANSDTAEKIASEGIVLLKNEGQLLPLDRAKIKHLVVLGPNATPAVTGGGGSSGVGSFEKISVLDGIKAVAGNQIDVVSINYFDKAASADKHADGPVHDYSPQERGEIAAADAVIFSGGLNPHSEHEGFDRDWGMPPAQVAELSLVASINPRVIVAINAGGNLSLSDALPHVPALLWAWYPGQNGNTALAKIIFGDINPSGHLPDTFEKQFADSPAYGNFPGDQANGGTVRLDEGIYVGYRWYDKKAIAPEFPFGFGLSYSTFDLKNAVVKTEGAGDDRKLTVSVDVTNTGTRDGGEIVQLYVRPVASTLDRPVQELKGFTRVELKAGETKTVTLPLAARDFATYDETSNAWITPPGKYEIALGRSSRDIVQTVPLTW